MALIRMTFKSHALMRDVPLNILLPIDRDVHDCGDLPMPDVFPALYLLHGIFDDENSWLMHVGITELSKQKKLAIIMPSGENSFYVNGDTDDTQYGTYIGEELVDFTRKVFPLSKNRKDTIIGGLSMGGFGALRNGLKYHDTFGNIIALSSALKLNDVLELPENAFLTSSKKYYEKCFGSLEDAINSDKNPDFLARLLKGNNEQFPGIYMACGTEDNLLPANRDFHNLLSSLKIAHTYEEGPGAHTWEFWDTYLKRAIDLLIP